MGLDLGGTGLKYALVSESGTLEAMHVIPSRASEGRDAVIGQLRTAVAHLREERGPWGAPRALGLGTPGTIDRATGLMTGALPNMPGWDGVPIVALLEGLSELPVNVDNDANLMALAEALVGAGQGHTPVLGVTVGTGIGAGLVIEGRIYHGAGAAGEIGHLAIVADGLPCPCGGRGCLEQYASGPALTRQYRARTGHEVDAGEIIRRWSQGEPAARDIVSSWMGSLGRGIAAALVVVHPQCLVMGGGVMAGAEQLQHALDNEIRRHCLEIIARTVLVRPARLGSASGVIGAGLMALRS